MIEAFDSVLAQYQRDIKELHREISHLHKKIERLQKELKWADFSFGQANKMVDGLEAKIELLRQALKPFADVVKGNWSHQTDSMPMSYGFGADKRFDLTLGDFRKARAALER